MEEKREHSNGGKERVHILPVTMSTCSSIITRSDSPQPTALGPFDEPFELQSVVKVELGAKQVERRRSAPHLQPPAGHQVHEGAYIRFKASCAAIKPPSKKWFVSLTHPPTRG